jgi:hypothetical protein
MNQGEVNSNLHVAFSLTSIGERMNQTRSNGKVTLLSLQSGMNSFTFSEERLLSGNRSPQFQLRPINPSMSDQIYRTHATAQFLDERIRLLLLASVLHAEHALSRREQPLSDRSGLLRNGGPTIARLAP